MDFSPWFCCINVAIFQLLMGLGIFDKWKERIEMD